MSTPSSDTHFKSENSKACLSCSSSDPESYHVFVGDLAPNIEESLLLATFNIFGQVIECKIIKDMHTQKPKGYGFVAYRTKQEAELAIRTMNGQLLGSRTIRTNWAVRRDPAEQAKDHRPLSYAEVYNASSPSNTTIYVGGITTGLCENLLRDAFREFGEIQEVRIFKEKGFSFIKFDSHASATRAIVTMHGRQVGDVPCKCSWGKEPIFSIGGTSESSLLNINLQRDTGCSKSNPPLPHEYLSIPAWITACSTLPAHFQTTDPIAAAVNATISKLSSTGSGVPISQSVPCNTSRENCGIFQPDQFWWPFGYKRETAGCFSNVFARSATAAAMLDQHIHGSNTTKTHLFENVVPSLILTGRALQSGVERVADLRSNVTPAISGSIVPFPSNLIRRKLPEDVSLASTYSLKQSPFNRFGVSNKCEPTATEGCAAQPLLHLTPYSHYALSLHHPTLVPIIPLTLNDINCPSADRCGLITADPVQRTNFIASFSGVY